MILIKTKIVFISSCSLTVLYMTFLLEVFSKLVKYVCRTQSPKELGNPMFTPKSYGLR